jgi:hypothetical protein
MPKYGRERARKFRETSYSHRRDQRENPSRHKYLQDESVPRESVVATPVPGLSKAPLLRQMLDALNQYAPEFLYRTRPNVERVLRGLEAMPPAPEPAPTPSR